MKRKIILVGEGGSGKDYLAKYLIDNGYKRNVAYTTRPIREGEIDGKDYKFITRKDFENKINEDFWHEYNIFIPEKKWYYGSSRENFEKCNLFIKEPRAISLLSKEERNMCYIIWIKIDENIRRNRMSIRRKNDDNVERRIEGDRKDFEKFNDYDLLITDPNFNPKDILEKIIKFA
jgi:guanylate kinase